MTAGHSTVCRSRKYFHALMPEGFEAQKDIHVCTGCGGLFSWRGLGRFRVGRREPQFACACCLRRLGFEFYPDRPPYGVVFQT